MRNSTSSLSGGRSSQTQPGPREGREDETDVQDEEDVRVMTPVADPGSAADPGEQEQHDGER